MGQNFNQNNLAKPRLLGASAAFASYQIIIEGSRFVIGRDPSQCNMVLEPTIVSKVHAVIEVDPNGRAFVTDLQSRNGTFINGAPVTRAELREGDVVSFGPGGNVAFTYRAAPAIMPPSSRPFPPSSPDERDYYPVTRQPAHAPPAVSPHSAASIVMRAGEEPVIRIGRAPDNDIVLDAPGVSRYHATLTYGAGAQPIIADLGSTNGTFVNGLPVREPRQTGAGDLVSIAGFLLRIDGRKIKRLDLSLSGISALRITKMIDSKTILKDISLAVAPREFVGLMGSSGCGKSTLMDALNGLRPASSGTVLVNELDLYRNFDALRRSIGHVPQRDILHDALTVERTLYYAGKLRLPQGTPPEQIRSVVDEVIQTVGLEEQRHTQFRQLSGGQQKRLSLGVELITKPSFIFLDEPTSPLDPETTENMMMLFRRLADEGRIVIMVTHKFEKFDEMHHVAILTKGGRLAFFGPPRESLSYFGVREPTEIYRMLSSRDPDEWSRSFQASEHYDRYVGGRIQEAQELARGTQRPTGPLHQHAGERRFGFSQWMTLTQRYAEVKLKDMRNTALLLLQAPLIALLVALIIGGEPNDVKTIFIAAVISIWFGSNNAIREIVSESGIYMRERLVNLKIPSYVFSKITVLGAIAFIQCLMFVGILVAFDRLRGSDFPLLMIILYLTSLGGITMGLFFSALVKSTEKAMTVLPLILIPQLLLSGFFKPVDDVYVKSTQSGMQPATVEEFRRFEDIKRQPSRQQQAAAAGGDMSPVVKNGGMGAASIASIPMIARWSIDGLVHTVSIGDEKTRDRLATNLWVAEYQNVFDKRSASSIEAAYRLRVFINLLILSLFIALFLALTMWALKRKDVL
jgi:ABC-type multidrug transport system ATPase subunit/ABC-type multidrug transport system permease subunit